jgi:FdhE protein
MTQSAWDRRIERAEELAKTHGAAAEILRFYTEIARVQKAVYISLQASRPRHPDVSVLRPHVPTLLTLVKRVGPAPLARTAEELAKDPTQWEGLLGNQETSEEKEFFSRALLQPYFEYQASQRPIAARDVQPDCPLCAELPHAGVLRGEGDGGKRSLICSLCSTEWDFRRLLCPNCGEESQHNLPVYTAEEFPHVRIEACETCHTYIKSVDLTKNGLAVPVVDELATISLNVWAEKHGYGKLQLNLLGM